MSIDKEILIENVKMRTLCFFARKKALLSGLISNLKQS